MAEVNMEKAREIYDSLIRMLDERDWKYDKYEDKLMIKSGIKGEDLPIEFLMVVRPKQQVIQLLSHVPATMPEDKRVEGALAVCVANNGLVNGSFDYDVGDGTITFRLTTSYRETVLSADLLEYMIMVSAGTIDDYNDKFFMISKNMMSIQDFIEKENA
jgi:hypothetical protein